MRRQDRLNRRDVDVLDGGPRPGGQGGGDAGRLAHAHELRLYAQRCECDMAGRDRHRIEQVQDLRAPGNQNSVRNLVTPPDRRGEGPLEHQGGLRTRQEPRGVSVDGVRAHADGIGLLTLIHHVGLREHEVSVDSWVAWKDTGIDVRSGQTVYFSASGRVRWGPNRQDGPAGEHGSPHNPGRPIPSRPLVDFIYANFVDAASYGDYELLVQKNQ